ncbi:MAG: hypothetical protein FWD77_08195 [Betaproteobacteria bacterium]|nr:hypothetical protein [Betaproteobacteria bacterium]
MKYSGIASIVLAAVIVAGCASEVPTGRRYAGSWQYKLQAAEHWRTVANDMATQITGDLRSKSINRPLYVPLDSNDFSFTGGFRELFTTALVNQGWQVVTRESEQALNVQIRYSAYLFRKDRDGHWVEKQPLEPDTSGPTPQTEVLVTGVVYDGTNIVARRSAIYYVSDEDGGHYWKKITPSVVVPVTGGN